MGIALFTLDGLFAPLQAAFDWFAGAVQARSLPATAPTRAALVSTPPCGRRTLPPGQSNVRKLSAGPVRVLRVVDGQAPASCGRMVISGSMADVCAELDRMASYEPVARRGLRAGTSLRSR